MEEPDWPPPLHARVRNGGGVEFVVIACHDRGKEEVFVVVRRELDGGAQALPVTRAEWLRRAFVVLR